MSNYDVMNVEIFAIEELTLTEQEMIQGGGKFKIIAEIVAVGVSAAIAGAKAVQAALD